MTAPALKPGPRLPAPFTAAPYVPTRPLAPTKNATGAVPFPDGFLWGAATAAQQIEGAAHEDGREDSIWDEFCRKPGAIQDGSNADVACDSYHRYADDVALLRDLNLRGYRFSTSWARVMPDGRKVNRAGLKYYDRVVDALLDAEITPFLTLYHWDLPQRLQDEGGWPNRDTAYRFLDYSMAVLEELGDRVTSWTTLNEPWCASYLAYIGGEHAPGHHSRSEGIAAAHHLLLGHGLVATEIKNADPDLVVGVALNLWPFDAADPDKPEDIQAAIKKDGTDNRAFLDPIFRGVYPDDVRGWYGEDLERVLRGGDLELISTPIDIFGLNYYNGSAICAAPVPSPLEAQLAAAKAASDRPKGWHWTGTPSPAPEGIGYAGRGLPVTEMGWDVQPEGLTRLLERVHRDYTGPRGVGIYITENGAAYADEVGPGGFVDDGSDPNGNDRLHYLDAHLRACKDAIDAGVDLRGYFAWSLMDTFEWAWGYTRRFGIAHTDFATQQRIPKASGRWYAEVAKTNTVPALE